MTVPVKRYCKTIWEDTSYTGPNESSSQKLRTRSSIRKSNLQKLNTDYLLSSMPISKVFYVNKTRVNHHHQDPSPPNTSSTYHVEVASMWNAVMDNTLKHPQVNIRDDAAEKLLDQVLAAATVCGQHLANKISMKRLIQEKWREIVMPATAWSAPDHSCQQIKKSATTIIWRVNIEVQLTTHATWITASIQRKWKFHASFTTSKVYCFSVIAIFSFVHFWNLFW